MQNFARRLMSGASLALMAVGGLPAATARASGITIKTATVTSLNIPFPQEYDYILVTDDGHITGDVLNQGFVGEPLGSPFGIEVRGAAGHPADIGGNITNAQEIRASSTFRGDGILVTGPYAALGGDILNLNGGDIGATAHNATQDVAAIAILNGAHFDGVIHNSGAIHALATVYGLRTARAEGVRIDNAGSLFAHTDINEAGGVIYAIAKGFTSAQVTARGYELDVHGDIGAGFVNDGMIAVTASESRVFGGGAHATGARISNFGGTPNTGEFGEIENEGLVVVNAIGGGTTAAARTGARGVDLLIEGAGGAADAAEALLVNDGEIGVKASANAFGVLAIATGATLDARDAFHATARASNEHLIIVTAVDHNSIAFADAVAAGIRMHVGSAAFAANELVNSGFVGVDAQAFSGILATAHATGIAQAASSVADAHNDMTNVGAVVAIASAKGDIDIAGAVGVVQTLSFISVGTNIVVNHGDITAKALASGNRATTILAAGVRQSAHAINIAHNTLDNSGHIEALASAFGNTVAGTSSADRALGVYQRVDQASTAHNYLSNTGIIEAKVRAVATGIDTDAIAHAMGAFQRGSQAGVVQNTAVNGNYLSASAIAEVDGQAVALATALCQIANATTTASNAVVNDGTIGAFASDAGRISTAFAKGMAVSQTASATGIAENRFENHGRITASAYASGPNATADAFGIRQVASAVGTAGNFASNAAGTIEAKAVASGYDAHASAIGIYQVAGAAGLAENTAINASTIRVSASAGGSTAIAVASGIYQKAEIHTAFNEIENSGTIEAAATALAGILAKATANGIAQFATGTHAATTTLGLAARNQVTNGYYIRAQANAAAGGSGVTAIATARAAGVAQHVVASATGDVAQDEVVNRGSIFAIAHAAASRDANRVAAAFATGIAESFDVPQGTMLAIAHNSAGFIAASAAASAAPGGAGSETARATADDVDISGSAAKLVVDVMNSGHIYASASAFGDRATARASGIDISNMQAGGVVSGDIVNSGYIEVGALAANGKAIAMGIGVRADRFVGRIVNEGLVEAAASGLTATAAAIAVTANSHPAGTGVGEIVNDGGEIAAYADHKAGWAIELANAPNEVDVLLEGDGIVYGNIGLETGDTITVANGVTFFDGTINPSPIGNVGTLTVNNGATLYLANAPNSLWGANAVVNVNVYNQPGTLELDVDASNNSGIAAHNAQIHANSANLTGGTVLIDTQAGIYPDVITYQVVFGALGGTTWSNVAFAPDGAISPTTPFFTLAANYPNANEADIVMTRVPFNAVAGLTPNEKGVGSGLEGGYSSGLTGPASQFYQSILSLSASEYPQALDRLADEEAGEAAWIDANFARDFTDMMSAHAGALQPAHATTASLSGPLPYRVASLSNTVPAPDSNRDVSNPGVWGGGFGTWSNVASTRSGPGHTLNDSGIAAGFDLHSSKSWLFGVAGAYLPKTSFRFGSYGTPAYACPSSVPKACDPTGSVGGFEVGAYSRYDDPSGFYFSGNFAYGNYDDTTLRFVSLPSLGSGFLSGAFASSVWSLYGESGYPIKTESGTWFTPYLAIAYIGSNSGAYTETGSLSSSSSTVADLRVDDASSTSVQSYLGGQLNASWALGNNMTLLPSLRAAWAHEFEKDIWTVSAYFSGIGPGSGFGPVTGSTLAKNSAVIDANVDIEVAEDVGTTFGYEGRFGGSDTNNFFFGRLNLKFP